MSRIVVTAPVVALLFILLTQSISVMAKPSTSTTLTCSGSSLDFATVTFSGHSPTASSTGTLGGCSGATGAGTVSFKIASVTVNINIISTGALVASTTCPGSLLSCTVSSAGVTAKATW